MVCDGALPSVPPLFRVTVDFVEAAILFPKLVLEVLLKNFLDASMYFGLMLLLNELTVIVFCETLRRKFVSTVFICPEAFTDKISNAIAMQVFAGWFRICFIV